MSIIACITKKYLGVPYQHQGRTMQGLDCWGFVKLVYHDLGYELLDFDIDYPEDWSFKGGNYIVENYRKQWHEVQVPQAFDLVLFHNSKGVLNHIGVYLSDGQFIHCCKQGVVVSKLSTPPWDKRINGFYRLNK